MSISNFNEVPLLSVGNSEGKFYNKEYNYNNCAIIESVVATRDNGRTIFSAPLLIFSSCFHCVVVSKAGYFTHAFQCAVKMLCCWQGTFYMFFNFVHKWMTMVNEYLKKGERDKLF